MGAFPRGGTTDKITGLADEAVGNDTLVAEDKARELKREAQKTVGDVKDGARTLADPDPLRQSREPVLT